jgi:hypothetical protein
MIPLSNRAKMRASQPCARSDVDGTSYRYAKAINQNKICLAAIPPSGGASPLPPFPSFGALARHCEYKTAKEICRRRILSIGHAALQTSFGFVRSQKSRCSASTNQGNQGNSNFALWHTLWLARRGIKVRERHPQKGLDAFKCLDASQTLDSYHPQKGLDAICAHDAC